MRATQHNATCDDLQWFERQCQRDVQRTIAGGDFMQRSADSARPTRQAERTARTLRGTIHTKGYYTHQPVLYTLGGTRNTHTVRDLNAEQTMASMRNRVGRNGMGASPADADNLPLA